MTKNKLQIKQLAIIGMGALGMMYAELIKRAKVNCQVSFVMDPERYQQNKDCTFTVNGQEQDFKLQVASSALAPDLLILATKYAGLAAALDLAEQFIGKDTIIISVLNGISSEEIIAKRFGWQQVLGCVAIGMDAVREGSAVSYTKPGRLQIGLFQAQQIDILTALNSFLATAGLAHTIEKDIRQALWAKFLLNVGINQACMVYETTYGGAFQLTEVYQAMIKAMQEVILIAEKEGVNLTEADLEKSLAILQTLNPDGYPSMRQDALARRPSEVELFAGTVLKIAARHQLAVPVNRYFYEKIQQMEASYQTKPELDFENIL